MTRKELTMLIHEKPMILDGAMVTNLQSRGMPAKCCPEQWMIQNREVVIGLQQEYIEAGSMIIYAPTFTANRIKLANYGLEDEMQQMNMELVNISKEAAGDKAFVAGNISMTGEQLYPSGTMKFEELVDIYKEQTRALLMSGVDLFAVETMMSLQETRAAVIAIREICDLPIIASMTFEESGRTLYGTDPVTAITVLQSLGADVVGANCSTGPDKMNHVIQAMSAYANIPIIAKPNAGLPVLKDGETTFSMQAEEFALECAKLIQAGASVIGGCCGTTPEHICALSKQIAGIKLPGISNHHKRLLASEKMTVEIHLDGPFMVVGERINPTGKKMLQNQLKSGDLSGAVDMALEQVKQGAVILDVNMGMNGIDEKEMMIEAIYEISRTVSVPLCIDSSSVEVIEAALRIYPGRALINSISMENDKMKRLLHLAKKYGAMFILLPLSDKGLPKDLAEKKEIIQQIFREAYAVGLKREDIIVDGLVTTVGANQAAALETFETISYCKKELELATICGLSNISFGLPDRVFINGAFLDLAMMAGLTMAIANPSQELLMKTALAADLLLGRENAGNRYIEYVNQMAGIREPDDLTGAEYPKEKDVLIQIKEDVLKGNQKSIISHIDQAVSGGVTANEILDQMLIPAINQVGELFEQKVYFLPQLIASAKAMETGIQYIEPMLVKKQTDGEETTIVCATVEGDIHDIGKNLVVLMLKNHGYRVIDLGKDVPKERIIQTAIDERADIIGLSALMTTTMVEMQQVIQYAKEQHVQVKVIVGGAVITEDFAKEIGADGYSKDANDAVKLVQRLLQD